MIKKNLSKRRFSLPALATGLILAAVPIMIPAQDQPAKAESSTGQTEVPVWTVDGTHSALVFKISHMGVGNVWGRFNELGGTIQFDPENLEESSIHMEVRIPSIDTGNTKRDTHLRSPDYFNAETNSLAEFTSTEIEHVGDSTYKVAGELSMMGKTQPLTTTFTWHGVSESGRGGPKTGAEAQFTLNRVEWGVGGPGGVGEEVTVHVAVEAGRS